MFVVKAVRRIRRSTQNIADDEKLLPGDIMEMSDFCDDAEKTSRIKIAISLSIESLGVKAYSPIGVNMAKAIRFDWVLI